MNLDIKRLPDKEVTRTVKQVSINGKEFDLETLISVLDDLYSYGKNRYEYMQWDCYSSEESIIKDMLEHLKVIQSHSGGSWKSTNFDEFYEEVYKINE